MKILQVSKNAGVDMPTFNMPCFSVVKSHISLHTCVHTHTFLQGVGCASSYDTLSPTPPPGLSHSPTTVKVRPLLCYACMYSSVL